MKAGQKKISVLILSEDVISMTVVRSGIVGHLGGVFSIIEDNHIHHINTKQDLSGDEIGGIKMHAAVDVIYPAEIIFTTAPGEYGLTGRFREPV